MNLCRNSGAVFWDENYFSPPTNCTFVRSCTEGKIGEVLVGRAGAPRLHSSQMRFLTRRGVEKKKKTPQKEGSSIPGDSNGPVKLQAVIGKILFLRYKWTGDTDMKMPVRLSLWIMLLGVNRLYSVLGKGLGVQFLASLPLLLALQ